MSRQIRATALGRGRRGGSSLITGFLFGLVLAVPLSAAAGGAERLQSYLNGLSSLSSRFDQVTLSVDGGRMVESEGMFYLKRPGKFRWEYSAPAEQVIIADGKRVWLHDLELDQVSHKSQDSALAGTPAQLLANDEPIERHFTVRPWEAGDEREWVELIPKAKDTQVVKIRMGFIGDRLDTMLMEDSFGQLTRFTFSGTQRNPTLKEDLFRLPRSATTDFIEF